MRIDTMTAEQAARMPEFAQRWIDIGLSTEPADFDRATDAALRAYQLCNLERPMVILRMSSPYGATLGGALAWALLRELTAIWSQVGSQVWSQVGSQVRSQVGSQVWSQVGSQVWSQVGSQVMSQVRSQVWSQVESQVRSQVRSQVESQVGSQVESQVGSQVWSQVRSQVMSQVGSAANNDRGGALWASWVAYIAFIRDVLGWRDPVLERFEIDETLVRSCGWVWWHETVLAISDRPEQLHRDTRGRLHNASGPAIRYRDGWALHYYHGVRMPADAIEDRSTITVKRIRDEKNAEVRRSLIELYGYERYVQDAKLKIVDKRPADDPIVGLRTGRLLRDGDIYLVDVLNSTPEPDGSVRRYVLRIDPAAYDGEASRNLHAAVASTWRVGADHRLAFADWRDYRPAFES